MHQSLVDRLIFMSEDDIRTERAQQGRGITGGGGGGGGGDDDDDGSDSSSGDDARVGNDRPSSVPTPPASGGGGAAPSGVGSREEPKQLLVLIGDAGGVYTTYAMPGNGYDRLKCVVLQWL